MKLFGDIFNKIIDIENLFLAWSEFRKNKAGRQDVAEFEFNLEHNIFELHKHLKNKTYTHGPYHSFFVHDPKQRNINKALVRDRLIHHAIFSILNPIFEPTFINHSYACRKGKGTHKGVGALAIILRKVSRNNTQKCFALKCDIRKFFRSVDHEILYSIIQKRINDPDVLQLVKQIIYSFPVGIPIGNLTSQLFANVYMNELDQFVKSKLRVPFYLRYTDDFVVVGQSVSELEACLEDIKQYLSNYLKLELHPNKISIRKYTQGVDFLGYVVFPHHITLRNKTKRRILNKSTEGLAEDSLHSYLGVLSHCSGHKIATQIVNEHWFRK